ncbi:hypothetical protein PDR31_28410 [Bacillus cereus]|nr:hypothetical protein [Bacillus cereus]
MIVSVKTKTSYTVILAGANPEIKISSNREIIGEFTVTGKGSYTGGRKVYSKSNCRTICTFF